MRVDWSRESRDDLADIHDYLAEFSEAAAVRIVSAIARRARQLQEFPESGADITDDLGRPLRQVFSGPYRIVYAVSADAVEVVTVRHGRRRPDLP